MSNRAREVSRHVQRTAFSSLRRAPGRLGLPCRDKNVELKSAWAEVGGNCGANYIVIDEGEIKLGPGTHCPEYSERGTLLGAVGRDQAAPYKHSIFVSAD